MSINKFSKYGIVLVAAITVATVAQSQFGQSSSKVYADEIASTAPKTSEVPSITPATSENVSTMPTTSEAPAVVLASENSEAPETSALYSEDGGLAVTPTDIVSPTSTTPSENSSDKSLFFLYVEHTDSGVEQSGTGVYGANEDGRFVIPEGTDYRYSYYTITSDDGKSFKPGDVIPYDSPLLNHPNFDDNPITYTYYKNKPSVEENIIVNPVIRPSWHHGDSISFHVRYGVFERNSKYGVPAVIDIAPYDTVDVPLDKQVTVSAKTIPGYTLDSANKYETGSDIPNNTLMLSSSYFVTDNTGTPMAMFLYKKNNSETAFKDSLTPSAKPSSQSEGPLTYTVIYHFTGEDSRSVEYTIEPGETKYLKLGGKGAVAFPVISGTPSFYEVSYDRVKAGKTLYEFWQYDYHTHNGDGTPKVTDTSSTPATSTTPATSEAPAVSTTPATSEAPAVSTTPATSEAPAVSTTPATSEAPAVSATPATSETPAVSTAPATSEAPANSTTPATSEAPAVSTTPATSETPAVSTTPATSETPAVSTTPATSEAPAVSTAPATSEAPAVSTTPATSEAPAVSTAPATSETPAVSTTPATSEAPAVSTTPATSEAPAVSTAPATSETPAVSTTPATSEASAVSTTLATSEAPANSTTPATSETPTVSTTPATSEAPAVSTTPATSLVTSKDTHSMNSVTSSSTQTRNAGIKSEADGKLTGHDLPKTGDTNTKVGMLGMVLVGLGLTSLVYKGRHRRSK